MAARPGTPPLPLPVARLCRRSRNAKSVKDRHDTAWYAWEVSLRVGVAANPPADSSALARGSMGHWAGALKLHEKPLSDPALLALFAHFSEHGLGKRSERRSISPRELVDASVSYRNRVLGHGSVREGDFYESASEALFAGLEAAWSAELFLPLGDVLLYSESVAIAQDGTRKARILDLSGETPLVLDPRGTDAPETILPRRLYLRRGESWKSLHPWLVFIEEGERIACFNALGRRAEFLDYTSGELVAAKQLDELFPGVAAELEALFGRRAGDGPSEKQAAEEAPDPHRFGEYQILGKLGAGAMGVVYLARQPALQRLVALKLLPPERAQDAVAVARFKREVVALSRCEHPNVVKILAYGEAKGTHYYAMEYVEGSDLRRIAARLAESDNFDTAVSSACEAVRGEKAELFASLPELQKPAPSKKTLEKRPKQLARFFRDAARGLGHLHAQGILHRDISPGNVMVTYPEGRAVIMDLGLARVEGASMSLTKDKSQIMGTLRYIAPEQLQRSLLSVDQRADVYSLGATMYELLADRPFFDGETEARLIQQVIREEPLPLAKAAPKVPTDLALIVGKATEKDPALRYEKAEAFANDLDNYLQGNPITARPPTPGYLLRKWVQRHKELALASAAALLVMVGGTVIFLAALQAKNSELKQTNVELAVATETAKANEKAAKEQTQIAKLEKANVLKLSAFQTLDDLQKQADDELWPVKPRFVDSYREWIDKAEELVSKLPEFQKSLLEIEQRALPASAEEREQLAREVASPPAAVERPRVWRFAEDAGGPETGDRWWHDQLLKLIAALELFGNERAGLIRGVSEAHGWGVAKRLEYAASVEELTLTGSEARQRWAAALDALASSEKYRGVKWPGGERLKPQFGLLPIGVDPQSGLWEFAELQSGKPAERGADGRLELTEETGLVFVLIPGGAFWMGAQAQDPEGKNYDPGAGSNEFPAHEVSLSPYLLSKYEMTQGQWERVTGVNPSQYRKENYNRFWNKAGKGGSALHPVEQVTWTNCRLVLWRLGCQLPTEAQWENGCRAGTSSVYWCGNGLAGLGEVANIADSFGKARGGASFAVWEKDVDDGNALHADVGSYRANGYGLHDVHGNVWEWCLDGYAPYSQDRQLDPLTLWGDLPSRVYRGGGCVHVASFARSAHRFINGPGSQLIHLGLRPARAISTR